MRKENLLYIPVVVFATVIFVESCFSQPEFIDLSIHLRDKIFHFIGYFFLGTAIQMAMFKKYPDGKRNMLVWITVLVGSLYGASDEIHQYFVPGRSCDILDWIADTLGTAFSLVFYKQIYKITMSLVAVLSKYNK